MNNLTITENGFGYIKLTSDIFDEYGVDSATAGNLINNFSFINEIIAWGFFSYDAANNIIRGNIRSRGPVINEVLAPFGGGGHALAAGVRAPSFEVVDEIIKELEYLKKKIAILTKIHTLQEMKVKTEVLREDLKILCPVIFVPPGVKKHQVVIPNNQLLIDDSKKNIKIWIENGGRGLIFDSKIDNDTDEKVKSLEFLIKR